MTESNRVEQVPSHDTSVGRVGSMLKVTGQMKGVRVACLTGLGAANKCRKGWHGGWTGWSRAAIYKRHGWCGVAVARAGIAEAAVFGTGDRSWKKNKHFFKKINVCFRKKIMIVSKNEKNYLCLAHVAAHCLHHTTPREKPSPQRRTAVLQSDALLVNSKD